MLTPAGDRVVTPEAVAVDLEPAGIGSRALAFAVDVAIQAVLVLGVVFAAALTADGDGGWVAAVVVTLAVFTVLFGYPIAFETLWRGRTPGKALVGLRVVTVEGAPVRFRHAAIRAAMGLVDFWVTSGSAAVLAALVSRRSQRLGDLAAGTLVLRTGRRTAEVAPATFSVPAGLEELAAVIDPAGLTPGEYGAVRQFLLRAPQLPAATRSSLAERLATTVAARVGADVPAGTSPEDYLRAVAARYQDRGRR